MHVGGRMYFKYCPFDLTFASGISRLLLLKTSLYVSVLNLSIVQFKESLLL